MEKTETLEMDFQYVILLYIIHEQLRFDGRTTEAIFEIEDIN